MADKDSITITFNVDGFQTFLKILSTHRPADAKEAQFMKEMSQSLEPMRLDLESRGKLKN